MSDSCPTVKIKNPAEDGGYMIINESDFDPASHALFDAPAEDEAAKPRRGRPPKTADAPAGIEE